MGMHQPGNGGKIAPALTAASASGRCLSRWRRWERMSSSALTFPLARTLVFQVASPWPPSNSEASPMNCPGPRVVVTMRSALDALQQCAAGLRTR